MNTSIYLSIDEINRQNSHEENLNDICKHSVIEKDIINIVSEYSKKKKHDIFRQLVIKNVKGDDIVLLWKLCFEDYKVFIKTLSLPVEIIEKHLKNNEMFWNVLAIIYPNKKLDKLFDRILDIIKRIELFNKNKEFENSSEFIGPKPAKWGYAWHKSENNKSIFFNELLNEADNIKSDLYKFDENDRASLMLWQFNIKLHKYV